MEKFLAAVRNMFNVPDLRRRIFFTLGLLAVYRLGAHVGAPGINKTRLDEVWQDVAGTLLGVLDLFSGGNFKTISVFALGVTPYITASIILQLMTTVFPQLKKLQEEGEAGRQKINERGIGNGISLLIFAGIVIGLPSGVQQVFGKLRSGDAFEAIGVIALVVVLLALIAFVVFVETARRKVPISYAKRHVGRQLVGGQQTHMPIKINMGGVIPVIFASSVLAIPQTLLQFLQADPNNPGSFLTRVATFFRDF